MVRWEEKAELILTIVTNLTIIPPALISYKRRNGYNFVICCATLITSILYHICSVWETYNPYSKQTRILGMNAGNWHRLDNVFAILLAQSLFLHFANFDGVFYNDILRWVSLCVCLYFQELSPWNIMCTIIPILFSVAILLCKIYWSKRFISGNRKDVFLASIAGVIAGYFFYKGLDDANDYLRLNHGLWHFFAGIAIYFFYMCRVDLEIKKIV